MTKYEVSSGPMLLTVIAETAYDAVIEALQCWGERLPATRVNDHRCGLAEDVTVRRVGSTRRGMRFATFEMIAHARCENPQVAWRRLLGEKLENPN